MSAEYITVTPVGEDDEEDRPPRRIMCHAIIAYYTNDEGENLIVLIDGQPVTILESPEQIDAQLIQYQPALQP